MKGIRTDTQSWSLLHMYVSTVGIVVQKELKQLFRQQKVNDNKFCISDLRRYYYLCSKVENFQQEASWKPGDEMVVPKGKGLLIIVK